MKKQIIVIQSDDISKERLAEIRKQFNESLSSTRPLIIGLGQDDHCHILEIDVEESK